MLAEVMFHMRGWNFGSQDSRVCRLPVNISATHKSGMNWSAAFSLQFISLLLLICTSFVFPRLIIVQVSVWPVHDIQPSFNSLVVLQRNRVYRKRPHHCVCPYTRTGGRIHFNINLYLHLWRRSENGQGASHNYLSKNTIESDPFYLQKLLYATWWIHQVKIQPYHRRLQYVPTSTPRKIVCIFRAFLTG